MTYVLKTAQAACKISVRSDELLSHEANITRGHARRIWNPIVV